MYASDRQLTHVYRALSFPHSKWAHFLQEMHCIHCWPGLEAEYGSRHIRHKLSSSSDSDSLFKCFLVGSFFIFSLLPFAAFGAFFFFLLLIFNWLPSSAKDLYSLLLARSAFNNLLLSLSLATLSSLSVNKRKNTLRSCWGKLIHRINLPQINRINLPQPTPFWLNKCDWTENKRRLTTTADLSYLLVVERSNTKN